MNTYKGLNKAQQSIILDAMRGNTIYSINDLPPNHLAKFEACGKHELMHQAADRFITDMRFNAR